MRTEGRSKVYVRGSDAGRKIEIHFCPDCGSSVFWYGEFAPDLIGVAFGAFADPSMPWPTLSVFETTRHPWVTFDHELDRFGRLNSDEMQASMRAPWVAGDFGAIAREIGVPGAERSFDVVRHLPFLWVSRHGLGRQGCLVAAPG